MLLLRCHIPSLGVWQTVNIHFDEKRMKSSDAYRTPKHTRRLRQKNA